MGQRGKSDELFFSFFIFQSFFCAVVTSSSLTKKKTKKKKTKKTKKKMIFNLEGLTVYFPYEYLYPVRFKRVDFLTLLFCYHFLRRASLSFRIRARFRRRRKRRRRIIIIIVNLLTTTHIITIIGTIRIHDRTETRVGRERSRGVRNAHRDWENDHVTLVDYQLSVAIPTLVRETDLLHENGA